MRIVPVFPDPVTVRSVDGVSKLKSSDWNFPGATAFDTLISHTGVSPSQRLSAGRSMNCTVAAFSQGLSALGSSASTSVCLAVPCSNRYQMPACSISRLTKSNAVSRYCTQYSSGE